MNWDAIGAMSELLAALAFIFSFLFVGNQLKQNREMERANNQREILNQARDFFSLTRSDSKVFAAVSICMHDYSNAKQEEKHIFSTWLLDFMMIAEQAWYMKRDGYINEVSFIGIRDFTMSIIVTPGGRQCWSKINTFYADDVKKYFEAKLSEVGDSVPKQYEVLPYLEPNM